MNSIRTGFIVKSILFLLLFAITSTVYSDTCQIIFDAGSSGTRLHAFKSKEGRIQEVYTAKKGIGISWAMEGKKCTDRLCTQADIDNTLSELMSNFFTDTKGVCSAGVSEVKLLATAGMRLAEQKLGSIEVAENYKSLKRTIVNSLQLAGLRGIDGRVEVRTLSGAEEGIFTLLTVNILKKSDEITEGIFEIGGASLQLAYACNQGQKCGENVYSVRINGNQVKVYSYSWLGLGRTEANRIFNLENAGVCSHTGKKPFFEQDCIDGVSKSFVDRKNFILKDPMNYRTKKSSKLGREEEITIQRGQTFHAAGGLGFAKLGSLKEHADEICYSSKEELLENKVQYPSIKYTPNGLLASQCFANVYFDTLLKKIPNLVISSNARKISETSVSWVLGAAICLAENCLEGNHFDCRWRKGWTCQ
jgi:hypothetical protein